MIEENLGKGQLSMQTALSRIMMPQGRPIDTPNLIQVPKDFSEGIDHDQVVRGRSSLGHTSNKVTSPNMSLNPARDLGYYR